MGNTIPTRGHTEPTTAILFCRHSLLWYAGTATLRRSFKIRSPDHSALHVISLKHLRTRNAQKVYSCCNNPMHAPIVFVLKVAVDSAKS